MTAERALERLFTVETLSSDWFASSFLAAVPLSKVAAITKHVRSSLGGFKAARPKGDHFELVFERGTWRGDLALDQEGRFTSLLIRPEDVPAASLDEAMGDFRALPGKVSVLVLTDGSEQASISPDAPLAVGSAFKLATLAALRADIDKKKRSWKDVVELRPETRSLPSGILQDWPDRSPLTVQALAGLMISKSDNTATDTLISLLGREAIEPFAPRNKPYLMTREMFLLKGPGNGDLLARFQAGDEATRRAILKELVAKPLPDAKTYPTEPTALDVEWYFTTRELCALMGRVRDLPLMSINPGVAKRSDWTSVAYKGGAEPGVLNMTTWVTKGTRAHCVAATWNAPQKLDEVKFSSAYVRLLGWLRGKS